MKKMMNFNNYSWLIFVLVLILVALVFNYQNSSMLGPQSIHHWRQADCASVALNYYQNGMNFFEPELHALISDSRTSGYNVGEMPFLYYFVAILYKIFGHHDSVFRIANMLFFFVGLFFLYKLSDLLLKDTFWAIFVSIFLFSSPVLVYYANSFLSNTTALAFSLIGWYFFFRFREKQTQRLLYISIIFFTIASLLKITAAISVVAIFGIYVIEFFNISIFKFKSKVFKSKYKNLIPFLVLIIVVIAWYLFAINYNQNHRTNYFSTRTMPIWDLSSEKILKIWGKVTSFWVYSYYSPAALYVLGAMFLVQFYRIKKENKEFVLISSLLFVGVILYLLLWFSTLHDHDYYLINLFILPAFVVLSFLNFAKINLSEFYNHKLVKTLFALFLAYNVYYASSISNDRYNGWLNEFPTYKAVHEISPYLKSIGIGKNDTVIFVPDQSSCYSLYLMNLKGWTEYAGLNTSKEKIQKSIELGAEYLIILGKKTSEKKPYLTGFTNNKIGEFRDVEIFRLR